MVLKHHSLMPPSHQKDNLKGGGGAIFVKDNLKVEGGGGAIFVKDNLKVVERLDLKSNEESFEATWIELNCDKSKNIVCGCVYRHPKTDIDELTNYISKCISKISKEKKESFIAGDFNVDLLKYECSSKHQNFLNMMTSSGFLPHILQPTRISEQSSTVIDNIYGNNLEQEIISGNILIQFADHLSQFSSSKKKSCGLSTLRFI